MFIFSVLFGDESGERERESERGEVSKKPILYVRRLSKLLLDYSV